MSNKMIESNILCSEEFDFFDALPTKKYPKQIILDLVTVF